MEQSLTSQNRPVVAFEAGQPLLFEISEALWNQRDEVGAYLLNYDLPAAFLAESPNRISLLEIVMPGASCSPPATAWTSPRSRFREVYGATGSLHFCLTEDAILPSTPLHIERERKPVPARTDKFAIEYLVLSRGAEELGRFGSAQGKVLPLVPVLPFIGCGLISGGPSAGWNCSIGPLPEHIELNTTPAKYKGYLPAAVLLDLRPRSTDEIKALNG